MAKLPFLQFFVSDWLADERLRVCSLAARGLWIDMLCLMHRNVRRGFLGQADGLPLTNEQLARLTGCSTAEAASLSQELLTTGVASADGQGVIFSRRMVRDEVIRQVRSTAGRKGAEATNLPRQKSGKPIGKPIGKPLECNCDLSEKVGGVGEGKTAPPRAADQSAVETVVGFRDTPAGIAQAFCFRQSPRKDDETRLTLEFEAMLESGAYTLAEIAEAVHGRKDRSWFWWQVRQQLDRKKGIGHGNGTKAARVECPESSLDAIRRKTVREDGA